MKTTGLIVTLCALAASALAQTPPPAPNPGQALTQEYAALYREYLDKKKLGLDAEAQTKYGEFLTAFRKHRLLARGVVSEPAGSNGPGAPGGLPGVPSPGGGNQGGEVGGHPGGTPTGGGDPGGVVGGGDQQTGGPGGTIPTPPGGDTGGGENHIPPIVPNPGQVPPGDGGISPAAPNPAQSAPPPGDGGGTPDSGTQGAGNVPGGGDDGGGAGIPHP